MIRKSDETEFKASLDRMRETVLARLEMKRPALGKIEASDSSNEQGQEDGFTIRRLWDRLFSSGE